jgi:hypothetical protein
LETSRVISVEKLNVSETFSACHQGKDVTTSNECFVMGPAAIPHWPTVIEGGINLACEILTAINHHFILLLTVAEEFSETSDFCQELARILPERIFSSSVAVKASRHTQQHAFTS